MARKLRFPIINSRERQNIDVLLNRDFQRAIYFELTAATKQKIIGRIPRNSLIIQPTVVHIIEPFNGNTTYIKVGTPENIESVGKVIGSNIGVFNLQNTGFSTIPTDYGRRFTEEKTIMISVVSETTVVTISKGSLIGVLFYIDLSGLI